MSKKLVSKQSNTIFNYFQSPKSKNTQNGTPTSQVNKEKPLETIKIEDEIAEEPIRKTNKKRSRVIDSDSDEENIPTTSKSTSQKFTKKIKRHSSSEDSSGADPSESKIIDKFESISKIQWLHEKLDFLEPNNIRDGKKRKMEDPEYDPHTLYVREDYLNTLTPAMRQWWVLKSKHYDSVLFFKVGKFYELYHMDAVVGVNYLGFSYMKGEFAHSGFPETAYGRMAQSLMEQGFKVARVEQTETPEMMKERCANKKCTKFDKVVNREICQVTTKGACVYGAQIRDAKDSLPSYMLAIAEKVQNDNSSRFGICFIDTSTGNINVGEFSDDTHCSKLLTLLSEHPPALVLIERNKTSNATCDILRKNAGNARIEKLSTLSQFHNAETTIRKLQEADYFKDKNGVFAWPETLNDIIIDGASKAEYELALSALGACWWYLKDSLLDIQVFTKRDFRIYKPFLDGDPKLKNEFMILDATTMENLNVLGKNGTIQKTLDFCCTAFGKRLLHQWLCRPLCNIVKVRGRQSCIQELYSNNEWVEAARNILKKLPDLNRQIMKIHTFGNKQFAEQHPDSRAIFYEGKTYASTKIFDLLNTLDGFEKAMDLPSIFGGSETQLLKQITQFTADGGSFCDLTPPLEYFKSAFDRNEAQKTGKIVFQMGVDTDFDNAEEAIRDVNKELDVYLQEQKKFFQCNVVYHGSDKKRYQLEVPENKCNRVTTDYTIESSRKGSKPVKRYSTARTKELLAKMMRAESDRASVLEDLNRRVFEKFNDWYEEWDQVAHCLAMLDVLCALAKYAMTYSQDICLPTILPFSDKPFIRIENARHPCIPKVDDYVPNDTALAVDGKPGILILTGPNMGGKSTLMRQVALIIVMAQIGSYVPAASCELTLVDRIFTRLGAQDDIMSGQSTFLVEMLESSAILQHATKHSFVLLDELGRGTSTHDGNAIATAYMRKLLEIDCRTIYSTHYHTLAQYYGKREDIQLGHMVNHLPNLVLTNSKIENVYKSRDLSNIPIASIVDAPERLTCTTAMTSVVSSNLLSIPNKNGADGATISAHITHTVESIKQVCWVGVVWCRCMFRGTLSISSSVTAKNMF